MSHPDTLPLRYRLAVASRVLAADAFQECI